MGAAFSISLSQADMAEVTRMASALGSVGPRALSRGINRGMAGVKTDASAEVRQVLNLGKATVDKHLKIFHSTPATLAAALRIAGDPIPLGKFPGVRKVKAGVSVQIRKDRGRRTVPGAFKATMASEHAGVFWRVDSNYRGRYRARMVRNPRNPQGRIRAQRLQITELFAPRIADYFQDKGPILSVVLEKGGDRIFKHAAHEISWEMEKLR